MQELSHDLEQVSGGDAAYNLGHSIGTFLGGCATVFCDMGKLYVPIL